MWPRAVTHVSIMLAETILFGVSQGSFQIIVVVVEISVGNRHCRNVVFGKLGSQEISQETLFGGWGAIAKHGIW